MEPGFTTAAGLLFGDKSHTHVAQLVFVVTGTPTVRNPVKAFKQGLSDEPADRRFRIVGARCSHCGFLEFYGDGEQVA
jgi:hypothetical protein